MSIGHLYAITYTTTIAGNYNSNATWESGNAPPNTLADGDIIIINHAVTLNVDIKIRGLMTINLGGSLIGNKNIKVGDGATTGELVNNGTISAKEIHVKRK